MAEPLVVDQSPREFFREAVSSALSTRRLRIEGETEFYLVNLLATRLDLRQAEGAGGLDEPLALILARALEGDRERRFRELRRLGDTALFLAGFFSDRLARSPVGERYYVAMGQRAYGALAGGGLASRGTEALYDELARRFQDFADLFAEISELAELRSNRGLVKLYERFLLTGSRRLAERLRARGVALFAPGRKPGDLAS
ncbi:MAG: hypothetical protein HZB56_08990 [Deltaproteobacteria bacterium]|nr:hypothetical protein [Deltaproteobacteria bacterium]